MSRSQGAATGGWPAQRHPAGEPDPRTGGRPAQRQPQPPTPQAQHPAPQYPAYPNAGAEPKTAPPAYNPPGAPPYNAPPAYHYPRQPQSQGQQYPANNAPPMTAPPKRTAPAPDSRQPTAAPPGGRGLSSLESARTGAGPNDFDTPRTQPSYRNQQPGRAPQPPAHGGGHAARPQHQQTARPVPHAPAPDRATNPASYRQAAAPSQPPAPQYASRTAHDPAADLRAPAYDQWPASQQPQQDALNSHGYGETSRGVDGYDLGGYLPSDAGFPDNTGFPAPGGLGYPDGGLQADPLQQGEWAMPAAGFADPLAEQQPYPGNQFGFDQPHGGALEASYNQDEVGEYEAEEPRRGSWAMRIAGAVVVAIGLGYGLAQAYKAVLGPAPDNGNPPIIESEATPARERPEDPGGRQFAHTDSKVLGRLSENENTSDSLSESDSGNGTRKVSTLVVGRDGSIAPPPAEPASHAQETVSVPGLMVVDAFGGGQPMQPAPRAAPPPPEPPHSEPVVMNQQPQRSGVNVRSTKVVPASTASIDRQEEQPAPAPKKTRVAAATPPAAPSASTGGATGANGYVVVLASVPASSTSRLDALRKFADMQQQYGLVLGNKTPDVREANLAGKGPYHRLLVGPPGSRSQANELCTQLKASGYNDCWVTAY